MPKYLWKCLNKLFWLCQESKYARSSYKLDRLLKMPQVEYSTLYKGYTEIWIFLIMASHVSLMPEYALISLNMPEHGWILLNVPEYAWINCSRVLNMPRYSYDNVIIVTNVIMLEFLPARFIHPVALLPFYLFWHDLEHKNNES